MSYAHQTPALRAVLLGASNLKMSLPRIVGRLRHAAGGPVEVLAACGHGRSYGKRSRIFFGARSLPGITRCGLWADLEKRPPLRSIALITDIGNDLLYGETAETIAGWVRECLERLLRHGAETICTPLPMISIEKVSVFRYHAARSILFPGRGVPWRTLLARARELDGRLRRLAEEHQLCLVAPQADWYGIDPIHFRMFWRRKAWDHILSHWTLTLGQPAEPSWRRLRLPLIGAEEYRLFGVPRHTPQPACRFTDGTTVALY